MGLSQYDSPFDVWISKVFPKPRDVWDNPWIYWGVKSEALIARKYAEDHGVKLVTSKRLWHPDHRWMMGTPDRLIVGKKKGLEIKTGQGKHRPRWGRNRHLIQDFSDAQLHCPIVYWTQCQWYMHLTQYPEWDLVVKLDSADYREYTVWKDPVFMETAIETCEKFWQLVESKTPPPLDWGDSCRSWLAERYPEHDDTIVEPGKCIDLGEAWWAEQQRKAIAKQLAEVKAEKNNLAGLEHTLESELNALYQLEKEAKNRLRATIGNRLGLKCHGLLATYKQQRGTRFLRIKEVKDERIKEPELQATTEVIRGEPGSCDEGEGFNKLRGPSNISDNAAGTDPARDTRATGETE